MAPGRAQSQIAGRNRATPAMSREKANRVNHDLHIVSKLTKIGNMDQ